jgi:hypothetical protein
MTFPTVELISSDGKQDWGLVVSGGMLLQPLKLRPMQSVTSALVVAADRVLAAGSGKVVLIELPSGRIVATYSYDGSTFVLFTRDRRHVVVSMTGSVTVLDTAMLRVVRSWSSLHTWFPTTELLDGRLMVPLRESTGTIEEAGVLRSGYYRLNIATGACDQLVVYDGADDCRNQQDQFFGLSSSGRYALRRHLGAVPHGVRPKVGGPPVENPGTHAHHPDVRADGINRFGIVLELWDFSDTGRLLDKIVVNMVDAEAGPWENRDWLATSFWPRGREATLLELAKRTDLRTSKPFEVPAVWKWKGHPYGIAEPVWEADAGSFWLRVCSSQPGFESIRRVRIDGTLSPVVEIDCRFADVAPIETNETNGFAAAIIWITGANRKLNTPGNDRISSEYRTMRIANGELRFEGASGVIAWDPTGLEGAPEDVIRVKADEVRFTPISKLPEGLQKQRQFEFDQLTRDGSSVQQPVADETEGAAVVAIQELANKFKSGLLDQVFDDFLKVTFRIGGRVISEETFFANLVERDWKSTAPALRELVMSYLDQIEGGEGNMPWPTGHALRALVLLDPDAHDVYRSYINKGDLEHDHLPYMLYEDYVRRHGIRNADDVRFGIYLTLMGFLDTGVDPVPLIQGAERLITADQFAAIVMEEAAHDEFWSGWGKKYVEYLGRDADAFALAVIEILSPTT